MAGQLVKAARITLLEQMAMVEGVSKRSVERYLAQRRHQMAESLADRQAIVRERILTESLDDHEELGKLIETAKELKHKGVSLVTTEAYGKRHRIRSDIARWYGIDQPVKHLHAHMHQGNGAKPEVSYNSPVQIIIDPPDGSFDPEFGSARISSPSPEEIESARNG
jgi:hypothetical protein